MARRVAQGAPGRVTCQRLGCTRTANVPSGLCSPHEEEFRTTPRTGLAGVAASVRRQLELKHAAAEERDLELTAAEQYARDPLAWIAEHAWIASPFEPGQQYDASWWLEPRRKLKAVRFELYTLQEDTIRAWIDLDHLKQTGELYFRDTAIEKSRQLGETWAPCAVVCWAVHYHPGLLGYVMSKVSADVDDGGNRNTIDSIFGRVRYIDQRLGTTNGSPLTTDRRRVPGCHDRLIFRPSSKDPAKVEHPSNGSVILGAAQTDNPARGKTLAFFWGDEAAFMEHGEKVYSSIDEACPAGKLLVSTVNGEDNFHARICNEKPAGYRVLRLHWTQHPIYSAGLHTAGEDPACQLCEGNRQRVRWNPTDPRAHRYPGRPTSPYYDARVIGKTDDQVANELDIDRSRAISSRVYPEFTDDVHVDPGGCFYDPQLESRLELHFDYGLDVTAVVVCQDSPVEYRVIGLLEMGDLHGSTAIPETVSEALVQYLIDLGVQEPLVNTPALRRTITAYGDPSGEGRDMRTGRPLVSAYHRLGWTIRAGRRYPTVDPSITSVKRLMLGTPKPLRVCGINAAEFATHARNNSWPVDGAGRRRPGAKPVDSDGHNHAMRAFAYGIATKWPPPDDGQTASLLSQSGPSGPRPLDARRRRGEGSRIRPGMTL